MNENENSTNPPTGPMETDQSFQKNAGAKTIEEEVSDNPIPSPNQAPGNERGLDGLESITLTAHPATIKAILDVFQERVRQVNGEGYSLEIDDLGDPGRLAAAAGSYLLHSAHTLATGCLLMGTPGSWPFGEEYWKPKSVRSNLTRAIALGLSELERLNRAQERKSPDLIRDPEEYM